jgi:hypothetical protein
MVTNLVLVVQIKNAKNASSLARNVFGVFPT